MISSWIGMTSWKLYVLCRLCDFNQHILYTWKYVICNLSLFHFSAKNTQFCHNCVLFRANFPNSTYFFKNLGALVCGNYPPIDIPKIVKMHFKTVAHDPCIPTQCEKTPSPQHLFKLKQNDW